MLPIGANLVIIASNYNPSIVSKDWLRQKEIFPGPVSNFFHVPVFALIENDDFSLTVDEARLQVTIKRVTVDNLNEMTRIAERFVEILPETPYKGIGMNYQYDVPEEKCDLDAVLSPDSAKLSDLLSSEYELGATLKFKYGEFVTTLTIQPSVGKQHQFRLSFNFHSNTASADELKNRLASQTAILDKAETIVRGLSKNA